MCVLCEPTNELERQLEKGAQVFAGAGVFTDALGEQRCGLTGVHTKACECWGYLPDGFSMLRGYRGCVHWDDELENLVIPIGQAPKALPAGTSS